MNNVTYIGWALLLVGTFLLVCIAFFGLAHMAKSQSNRMKVRKGIPLDPQPLKREKVISTYDRMKWAQEPKARV